MRSAVGKIYCQRCRAANSVADESCAECGTRLMLVVEPTGHRFEDASQVAGTLDEHLLERISLLENNLSRVIDKLERTLDLMLRQAQTSHTSHDLLEALISTLAETGALNRRLLRAKWGERSDPAAAARPEAAGFCDLVVERYEGPEVRAFRQAVAEGWDRLAGGDLAGAVRSLEKASALDAGNAPLNQLLGRALLSAGRPAKALAYLRRAAKAEPEDPRLGALLGLALAETGDADRAAARLRDAAERGVSSYSLHLALGQLAAARRDWREARAQLKLALGRRACPEALYLLARAHRRLGQPRAAAGCLRRAADLDPDHAAAWDTLGRLLAARGDRAGARKARAGARRARAAEAARRGAGVRGGAGRAAAPGPGRRLLSGGEPRLLRALAADLLGADLLAADLPR